MRIITIFRLVTNNLNGALMTRFPARETRYAIVALFVSVFAGNTVSAQTPVTGNMVLQRMHDTYDGKWYHTLTFVQKTTRRRPDGSEIVSTWLESMRHTAATGTQLRIDIGDLKD